MTQITKNFTWNEYFEPVNDWLEAQGLPLKVLDSGELDMLPGLLALPEKKQELTEEFCGSWDFERHRTNAIACINRLQVYRDYVQLPIKLTSTYRCWIHNKLVGGVPYSQHIFAAALDFWVKGKPAHHVHSDLDPIHEGGLGKYKEFVHADLGPYDRWIG